MSRKEIWKRIKKEILEHKKEVFKIKNKDDIYEIGNSLSYIPEWVYNEVPDEEYLEVDTGFLREFEINLNTKLCQGYKDEFKKFLKTLDHEIAKDCVKNI